MWLMEYKMKHNVKGIWIHEMLETKKIIQGVQFFVFFWLHFLGDRYDKVLTSWFLVIQGVQDTDLFLVYMWFEP